MAAIAAIILLTGAPDSASLSWDEANLLTDFDTALKRFLAGLPAESIVSTQLTSTVPFAKWRSVGLRASGRLPTSHDNLHPTQFLSFQRQNAKAISAHEQSDFIEHSVAVLDDVDSSQILPQGTEDGSDTNPELQTTFLSNMSLDTSSMTDTSFATSSMSLVKSPAKVVSHRILGSITDLKRIPNADYVSRLQPQTMTVNLLAGIISISPSRTVRLRGQNREMDIVELTMGDETRAGFSISFWLMPIDSQWKPADDLRGTLGRLRTGDVIVLQNVALSCFNGCVYGQSLSRRFARNSTSITVLKDESMDGEVAAFCAKVERVRQWTSDFVGVAKHSDPLTGRARHVERREVDELPPDTQD